MRGPARAGECRDSTSAKMCIIEECLSHRKCPWATSDDEMATKGCHERWHLHSSNGKIRDSNARPSMLNGSDKQRLGLKHTPAPPSTVNSCISAINEPSYPPTAVTTRVEGSMTPSEQAAVEARISALEAEV